MLDFGTSEERAWLRDAGGEAWVPAPQYVHVAEDVALAHLERADELQPLAGYESVVLAHRLAAATLFSLSRTESDAWWLAVLVRDIIRVGEGALPRSLDALVTALGPVAAIPFRAVVEDLTGDVHAAERHFAELIDVSCVVAREVAVARQR